MIAFILAFLPIAVLLLCLLVIGLPAKLSSALAFLTALTEFLLWARPGSIGMLITLEKGFAMSLFVGLIAFSAMLLYNLVDLSGGFSVIQKYLTALFADRFVLFLLISWVFSAFLQGIAGYGLPAVIATSILMQCGFPAPKAAAASLIGHAWAISFGSMGSSIYAIDLVTQTPLGEILIAMSRFGAVSMLCCGLGICFVYGGVMYVVKGLQYVLPTTVVMSVSLLLMAKYEMVSVIGFVTGLAGIIALLLVHRIAAGARGRHVGSQGRKALLAGVLPYMLVIVFSIGFFLWNPGLKLSLSFPGYEMLTGIVVEAETDYVVFNIFKYPFTIILLTSMISTVFYHKTGRLERRQIRTIFSATAKKIVPTEVTLLFLLCTASIMMDAGMTSVLAETLVSAAGTGYGFMAAMIGLIGTFITGTNTNSNILFGALQESAAFSLGFAPALLCALQSISASVGGAIGPTNTALVAATAELTGEETKIYRYTIPVTVASAAVLGFVNLCLV